MVADSLVYHPSVTHYLKFVATTGKTSSLLDTSIRRSVGRTMAMLNAMEL